MENPRVEAFGEVLALIDERIKAWGTEEARVILSDLRNAVVNTAWHLKPAPLPVAPVDSDKVPTQT